MTVRGRKLSAKRGAPVPPERLRQIQFILQRMLLNDRSAHRQGPVEQYGAAAERMIALPVDVSPVKEIASTPGCEQRNSPAAFSPNPWIKLKTPFGLPELPTLENILPPPPGLPKLPF